MIYTYLGNTVRFFAVLTDYDGTALTSETPILTLEDVNGSNVTTGTGAHTSDGTYYYQTEIGTAFGTGPAKYRWDVSGINGTLRDIRTNELLVLAGTSELPAYTYEAELPNYYSNITDYDMARASFKLTERYHYINRLLEGLNIKAPRAKNADGQYDHSLRAMNAWFAIYDIVAEDESKRNIGEEKPWYSRFWGEGTMIYDDIKKKKIVFRDQVSPSETGISKSTKSAGTSAGTMYTNWDRSYGKGFQGADFDRDWTVKVIGTGTAGGVNEGTFTWTNDRGINYGTVGISYGWIGLIDEVYIRFDGGSNLGTGILEIGDTWTFTTIPIKRQVGGLRTAKSY